MTGAHVPGCCCGDLTCYCGTRCVGCESACTPSRVSWCITEAVWDANIGSVAGTGTGLVIQVSGVWYYFDGTTGECTSIAPEESLDWTTAFRSNECPAGCNKSFTLEWSGSVTYGIACCVAIPGTPDQYYYDKAGTGTQSEKESPTMTLDDDCLDQNENTALEYMVGGATCGESYLLNVEDENFRLNFRLFREEDNCLWRIRVSGGGTVPANVPNEAAGTGWRLEWTAPLSLCPPTSGWSLDESSSILPIEQTPDCDNAGAGYVTEFTVGGISVNY